MAFCSCYGDYCIEKVAVAHNFECVNVSKMPNCGVLNSFLATAKGAVS